MRCVSVLALLLLGCGEPAPGLLDAAVDAAVVDMSAPDGGVATPATRPDECVDRYDVFSSQRMWLRDGGSGPLLYSEVLSRGPGTWHGLYVDRSQVSEGEVVDLSATSADPRSCAVCYFLGTECTDPADWRTCGTMRLATRGRVWIGRFPEAVGDEAVVEMADVFLEPRTLDGDTLRIASAEGGCVYQRYVSYTTGSVEDGERSCVSELHCAIAER